MGNNGDYDEDDDFIKIAETEDSEFMEFPKEEDGSVLLSTIQTQFPSAIGIKYKGSSGAWRAIKEVENVLAPPKAGWGDNVYTLTVSENRKRKVESSESETSQRKQSRSADALLKDLAVIGLPYKLNSDELKEYFEKNYGELAYCEVKVDRATGKSRGFGFIRFNDEDTASEALKADHYIMGRRFEVRLKVEKPMKLFVGRLPNGTTQEELDKHFSQFGTLKDTYVPQPFRNFGFITYASTEDGRACLREEHSLDGVKLNVMERNVDNNDKQRSDDRRGGYGGSRGGYGGSRGGGGGSGGGGGGGDSRGYTPRYNDHHRMPSHQLPHQQPAQNDMANELKNMLFSFLTNK